MPEVEISIGGRFFEVACQEGEEKYLDAAAKLLDKEAAQLSSQIGRLSETRLLLMAGLMLADKMSGLNDTHAELNQKLELQDQLIGELRAKAESQSEVTDSFRSLVARAEAVASSIEEAKA